jgi:hypothetical protein
MRILRSVVLTVGFLAVATFVVVGDLPTVVLNATSGFGPALSDFNGIIRMAWTTQYEVRIARYGPGPMLRNDHGLREYSRHSPALAVFNKRLYIAWTGTDKYALLNVKSSQDGETFDSKVTIRTEDSAYGPALAVFNNRLYLAWTGVDKQHSLNIISSSDGVKFTGKQILGQSSISAPALMATPAGWPHTLDKEQLLITWTGPDKGMNIAGSNDGVHFDFSNSRIPSETSNDRPVLFATKNVNGTAYMALWFTGTDARLNRLASNYVTPFPYGPSFGQKSTYDDTSIAGPALLEGAYLAWTGTDDAHHLNIKLVNN